MISILLAYDHRIMREGLRQLLDKQPSMKVVAEANDGQSAVELAGKHLPDVVVLDAGICGLNGIEATRRIIRENPAIKVLALSLYGEDQFSSEIMKAGSAGYLSKNASFQDLVDMIHKVVRLKETDSSHHLPSDLLPESIRANRESRPSLLTSREREILQLIVEGFNTKEIASLLSISIKTVETHRMQIMKKLRIFNIAHLTKYAICRGITTLAA